MLVADVVAMREPRALTGERLEMRLAARPQPQRTPAIPRLRMPRYVNRLLARRQREGDQEKDGRAQCAAAPRSIAQYFQPFDAPAGAWRSTCTAILGSSSSRLGPQQCGAIG